MNCFQVLLSKFNLRRYIADIDGMLAALEQRMILVVSGMSAPQAG
jgi:hypothetical protein